METLFNQFLKEKRYLKNCSEDTLVYLSFCFKALCKHLPGELTKANLQHWVIAAKEAGKSDGAINSYSRGINSFLAWLYENGHLTEQLKIRQLKTEQKVMRTFTEAQLRAIVSFKPKTFYESRLHALLCLLMDTGIRIDEALTLTRDKVNFDDLLITVRGKGNKERTVPFSIEYRKILFKFLGRHKFDLVFCTNHGGKILYDNCRRDFQRLMKELGIEGFDGSFHAFRRTFAKNYVRSGGNLFYLMKSLGHTTLTMSKRYCEVEVKDLQITHLKTSLLSRLK